MYTGQEYDKELEGYWLGERIYREEYGSLLFGKSMEYQDIYFQSDDKLLYQLQPLA